MPEAAGEIVMWMGREGRRKDHRCHAEDHELLGEDVKETLSMTGKAVEEWKSLKQVYLQVCLLYVTGLEVRSSQLCENIPMERILFIDVQVRTYMILTLHFLNVYILLNGLVYHVHFTICLP